jgi:hypothetical protein
LRLSSGRGGSRFANHGASHSDCRARIYLISPCFQCPNCFGDGPPPFVVIPEFSRRGARFVTHRRKVYIMQSGARRASHKEFKEWAVRAARRRSGGSRTRETTHALFLDNALTRGNSEAMRVFQHHSVMVVLPSPHPAHVMKPEDDSRANAFKGRTVEAWRRDTRTSCDMQAAFTGLRGNSNARPHPRFHQLALRQSLAPRLGGCWRFSGEEPRPTFDISGTSPSAGASR